MLSLPCLSARSLCEIQMGPRQSAGASTPMRAERRALMVAMTQQVSYRSSMMAAQTTPATGFQGSGPEHAGDSLSAGSSSGIRGIQGSVRGGSHPARCMKYRGE